MTGHQRRNLGRRAILGIVITGLLAVMTLTGLLTPLERRLSDQRTAWCQFDVPPPSNQLIHLDIDDSALEAIHRWPWPRGIWADVLDELRLAGAHTVAFDVLFSEHQNDGRYSQADPFLAAGNNNQESGNATTDAWEDDARFAKAIEAHGNVILPATFSFNHHSAAYAAMVKQLKSKPQLIVSWETYRKFQQNPTLFSQPVSSPTSSPASQPATQPARSPVAAGVRSDGMFEDQTFATAKSTRERDMYLQARRQALFELLTAGLNSPGHSIEPLTLARAQTKYFPDIDPAVTSGPMLRLLRQQYEKAVAYCAIRSSYAWVYRPLYHLPKADDVTPPIAPLALAAGTVGFVDVVPDADGVVRGVSSSVGYQGSTFSQMGLALAQLHGASLKTIIYQDEGLRFLGRDGVHPIAHDARGRIVIPWTGQVNNWQSVVGAQNHLAVGYVWEAANLAKRLNANRRTADRAIYDLYRLALDQAKAKELAKVPFDFEDDQARSLRIASVLKELKDLGYPDALADVEPQSLSAQESTILAAIAALGSIPRQNENLAVSLAQRRADLHDRLDTKAVLVGFTASGLGDVITTPLHTRCPGVIAHGAIFNAVMTNSFWTQASWKITLPVVLLAGIAGTLMALLLSPAVSAPAVGLLLIAYVFFNGLLVFDRWNMQLALAGPLLAGALSWAGCSFMGLILERRERARITRRFQNYVDPTLVNYVIQNPDKARLEGEARTMSVVFTDLEGFTKLSSTIHERVVPVINHYLEHMIPPIHTNNGYVNKFLGDGIMFFFGAPVDNPKHASDALNAIMQMQNLMEPFNAHLRADGLDGLHMRVGMTTGRMIVGDAGSQQRSDYTVMGDQVNFAARLESANKATGTSILINDTAAELVQDQYLLRPIGRLQVVGRSQAVMCFEPLCLLTQAGHPRRKLVQMTHELIQAYTEKRWQDCLKLADEIQAMDHRSSKLMALYRVNVARQQNEPTEGFDGRIELTSK